MKDCEDNHTACQAPKTKFMPRRVIDVGSQGLSDNICLVEPEECAPYIALSYCWGTTKRYWLVTTKDNITAHYQSVPLNRLPRTLLNAVNFTKTLGIRYLWIDSLCIVQDDKVDWMTEAVKICDIYFHASLVISANSTPDCTIPSFHSQEFASKVIQTTFRPSAGFEWCNEIYVRISPNVLHMHTMQFLGPRDSRGWCLQESLLARRELRFTPHEMQWSCAETEKCECLEWHPAPFTDPIKALKTASKMYFKQPTGECPTVEQLYTIWRGITHMYTQRALTYQSDKLVAISSLARVIKSALTEALGLEETYLAGLWKGDLARGLLWYTTYQARTYGTLEGHGQVVGNLTYRVVRNGLFPALLEAWLDIWDIFIGELRKFSRKLSTFFQKSDEPTPQLPKPRTPTWSWASISSPVSYFLAVKSPFLEYETFRSEIEILEAEVEASPLNDCGPVESGQIKLTGQMVEVHLRSVPMPSAEYEARRGDFYYPFFNRPLKVLSIVRTADNRIDECLLDTPIEASPPLDESNFDCWFSRNGRRCNKTDCGCRRGWSLKPYWCLKIGTARGKMNVGPIAFCASWLLLKKSEATEGVYERVGTGYHTWLGNGPCYFRLFDGAEKATITIV